MSDRGFTLVELLVAVAMAAILACVGAAGWQRWRARTALDSAASQTLAGLALARRVALATGRPATLCLTDDLLRCDLRGHEWMLFGGSTAANREPGEPLVRRFTLPGRVHVSGTRGYATYLPRLRAASTLTFEYCHPAFPALRREVIVSQTGRARLVRSELSGAARCGS